MHVGKSITLLISALFQSSMLVVVVVVVIVVIVIVIVVVVQTGAVIEMLGEVVVSGGLRLKFAAKIQFVILTKVRFVIKNSHNNNFILF